MIEQMTKRLAPMASDIEDLLRTEPDWQQSIEAAYSAAGEIRAIVEALFTQEAEMHLLQDSLPRRQVWWAVSTETG